MRSGAIMIKICIDPIKQPRKSKMAFKQRRTSTLFPSARIALETTVTSPEVTMTQLNTSPVAQSAMDIPTLETVLRNARINIVLLNFFSAKAQRTQYIAATVPHSAGVNAPDETPKIRMMGPPKAGNE